jgi:hypothetical protein
MKIFTALVLALVATSSFAVGIGNDNPPGSGGTSTNINTNAPRQDQAQLQGQAQASSNRNSNRTVAGAQANNTQGNLQTITVNEAPIPAVTYQEVRQNDYTVRTPAAIVTPNVYPTAPCLGSWSAGVSGVFGNLAGVSGGSTVQDDDCGYRETARSFSSLGLTGDAIAALCESKYAKNTPSCKKLASGGAVEPSPVVTPVAKSEPTCNTEIDGRGIRTTVCR